MNKTKSYNFESIHHMTYGFISESRIDNIILEFTLLSGVKHKIKLEQDSNNIVHFTPAKNIEQLYNDHLYLDYGLNCSKMNNMWVSYDVLDGSTTNKLCFISSNIIKMMCGMMGLMWSM